VDDFSRIGSGQVTSFTAIACLFKFAGYIISSATNDSEGLSLRMVKICLACNREFSQNDLSLCPHDGTALISLKNADPLIDATVCERYLIQEKIGEGRTGSVYKARDQILGRNVAIKVFAADLFKSETTARKFQEALKTVVGLRHSGFVSIESVGCMPTGELYIVTSYLPGWPLSDEVLAVRNSKTPDIDRVVRIFSQLADTLQYLHHSGIIHRNIKPSNILVNENSDLHVRIMDVFLCHLQFDDDAQVKCQDLRSLIQGNIIYFSPEQCMGTTCGPASDIYSLGVLLYETLVGKPPFEDANPITTASRHLTSVPPRFFDVDPKTAALIPETIEHLVFRMLAKPPEDRPQTMLEVKDSLQAALTTSIS
jgi:eukaryotic-like serine/threonine-protein kinase